MLNYEKIMAFYARIHKRIWTILFKSNFKRFGKTSRILYPLTIQNAKYIEIGEQVSVLKRVWLAALKIDENIPKLIIDDFSRIGNYSTISAVRDVYIGKNVLVADRAYISDNLHNYEDIEIPIKKQPTIFKNKVVIGDNSWIGANVAIIGAQIGKHCVIGSNSVVTKDIPDYSVAVGIPAKVIKKYNLEKQIWDNIGGKTK